MEESEKMEMEKKKTMLTDSKNRLQELERLMCRIYEDMILEKIPNIRYEILNNQYETEQRELSKEIDGLEKAIKRYEKETDRAKKFIRLIERCARRCLCRRVRGGQPGQHYRPPGLFDLQTAPETNP